jgi:hypothetical protein
MIKLIYLFLNFTGSFKALRRKNDLQLSQDIASKLYPNAGAPQIAQTNKLFLVFFGFNDC